MARITVLVVDDSVVVRRLVTDALSGDPEIEVVGVAANGQIALTKVDQLKPDVVTMDVEMPVMTGIESVRALRRAGHRMPIIMFSTLTARGAAATLDALAAGATDYVTKPTNSASLADSMDQVAADLIPRIKAFVKRPTGSVPAPRQAAGPGALAGRAAAPAPAHAAPKQFQLHAKPTTPRQPRAVIIGSSTGGPEALSRVVRGWTVALPVPIVIVQHMPPVFTTQLAARLDRLGPNRVVEAGEGDELHPGTAYIAPGDFHLELRRSGTGVRTHLQQGPAVNFCRPAVDVMFRSAVDVYGGDLLAVILTGMGSDGRNGCEAVVNAGGTVVAQDEATSVVWGMPGAVTTAGLAHEVVAIDQVSGVVQRGTLDRHVAGASR